MILLLDTDVLIDLALDRTPHAEPAAELVDAMERHPGTAYVAWHTIANFYYLVVSQRGHTGTRKFIEELIRFVEVAPTSTDSVRYATELRLRDFEDALQVAAAVACRADVIATRNVKNYRRSPVKAVPPRTLVQRLRGR